MFSDKDIEMIVEAAKKYLDGESPTFKFISKQQKDFFERRSGEMANTLPLKGNEETPLAGSSPASGIPNYRVYGPYKQQNGRRIVHLYLGSKRMETTTYARYLMERHLGRRLTDKEEVDHIDGNFNNDSLQNLQVISKKENVGKTKKTHCSQGHLRIPENTTKSGHCRLCQNAHMRKRYAKNKYRNDAKNSRDEST